MTLTANWEHQLIKKATINSAYELIAPLAHYGDDRVDRAYDYCTEITKKHSKTFYLTSGLLGGKSRRAARVLYAFCRESDNIIDEETEERLAKFEIWKQRSLTETPEPDDLIPLAWAHTRSKFSIPKTYAEQLLDGVAQDLVKNRYQNFDELAHYCYGVASTVGLMTMHLIGFSGPEAIPYAIKLGVALQMTNILRDVGEDWQNGRVYLPQDELAAFSLSDDHIARGLVTPNWREFMSFQIERTRNLYKESIPGINLLRSKGRFAIMASADLYQQILVQIEQNDYDVFNRRAYVSKRGKFSRLPGIWLRTVSTSQRTLIS